MTTDNLPTFRKWGAQLLARRRAIIIAMLILAVHYAGTFYLKRYYAVLVPCDQPCQDGISCEPLEFTFEVMPPKLKSGEPHYLWYRARIKNRSCRELAPISVDGFLIPDELGKTARNLWITVNGPDGREIDRLPAPGPDGGIAWNYGDSKGVSISTEGIIYPYQPDYEKIIRLYKTGKLNEPRFIYLKPGESFETITSVLRPYRVVATSVRTEDGGLADGYGRVRVENPPAFPAPPDGFIHLDRYRFNRPGRYTISAGFTDKLDVDPIFARWENRSRWLDFFFWPTFPSSLDTPNSQRREVNLVAPPVILEVVK